MRLVKQKKKINYKKQINLSIMIEFEKITEKGEKVKAYTHHAYLSSAFTSKIQQLQSRNQTLSNVTCYGTTILSYWALHKFAVLHNFVQNKLSWKGKFLIVSAAIGFVDSFILSAFLTNSLRNTKETLLKKEVYPAWFQKERVVNPDRVFFQLDDNNNNEPTIWHSSISKSAIERITPDFVIGTPQKPHYPVAEHHHH